MSDAGDFCTINKPENTTYIHDTGFEHWNLPLNAINPHIDLFIVKRHKSPNVPDLDKRMAIPRHNILGSLAIREADRIIVGYALSCTSLNQVDEIKRTEMDTYFIRTFRRMYRTFKQVNPTVRNGDVGADAKARLEQQAWLACVGEFHTVKFDADVAR